MRNANDIPERHEMLVSLRVKAACYVFSQQIRLCMRRSKSRSNKHTIRNVHTCMRVCVCARSIGALASFDWIVIELADCKSQCKADSSSNKVKFVKVTI